MDKTLTDVLSRAVNWPDELSPVNMKIDAPTKLSSTPELVVYVTFSDGKQRAFTLVLTPLFS